MSREAPPEKGIDMKLGLSLQERNLEKLLDLALRLGLRGLFINPRQISELRPAQIKRAITDKGLELIQWGGWTLNPLQPSQESLASVKRSILTAGELGVPTVVVQPGSYNANHPFCAHPDNHTDAARRAVAAILQDLAAIAGDAGTTVAVECHFATAAGSFPQCLDILKRVDSTHVKLQMDMANMIRFENYWDTAGLINQGFDLLHGRIAMAHAKDIVMRDALHLHLEECPAGEGCVDYPVYLQRLEEELGKAGYLIIEHTPVEALEAAVQCIHRAAEQAGVTLE